MRPKKLVFIAVNTQNKTFVIFLNKKRIKIISSFMTRLIKCCGAVAGGAEIILGPGAGAENKL